MARIFNFSLENPLLKGVLFKKGALTKAFKRRFFVLYPGFLVYYDDIHKWKVDVWRGNTLGGRSGAVYLKGATCEDVVSDSKRLHFGVSISSPDKRNKSKHLELSAIDAKQQDTWIAAIKLAIPQTLVECELAAAELGPEDSPKHTTPLIAEISPVEALLDATEAPLCDCTEVRHKCGLLIMPSEESENDISSCECSSRASSPQKCNALVFSTAEVKVGDYSDGPGQTNLWRCADEAEVVFSVSVMRAPCRDKQCYDSANKLPKVVDPTKEMILQKTTTDVHSAAREIIGVHIAARKNTGVHTAAQEITGVHVAAQDMHSAARENTDNAAWENANMHRAVRREEQGHCEMSQCLPQAVRAPFTEKRGFLYKEGGKNKSWHIRYIVVRLGYFEYYNNATDLKPISRVVLTSVQTSLPEQGHAKQPFQFTVYTKHENNKRANWVFSAVKNNEMQEWMTAFKLAGQGQ